LDPKTREKKRGNQRGSEPAEGSITKRNKKQRNKLKGRESKKMAS